MSAAAAFAAAGAAAGVEIARDDDPDRLDPARHVEHRAEAAFDDDVVVLGVQFAPARLTARLLEAEELETLVVIVTAACDRCEIAAAAAGVAG